MPLAVGIIEEVMFPLMVDERDGLIGPAVAELFALLLAEPLAVGIIEVILAELLTEPLAVGIMEEVVFPLMLMVEDRVGLTGPAVPVPGIVLLDMVIERVGFTGPAVPVPGMLLFIERVRLVGAKVELPVPVIMEEVMLPLIVDERLG